MIIIVTLWHLLCNANNKLTCNYKFSLETNDILSLTEKTLTKRSDWQHVILLLLMLCDHKYNAAYVLHRL